MVSNIRWTLAAADCSVVAPVGRAPVESSCSGLGSMVTRAMVIALQEVGSLLISI